MSFVSAVRTGLGLALVPLPLVTETAAAQTAEEKPARVFDLVYGAPPGCPTREEVVARIRSLIYYVVGGGLALAAVPLLARYGQGGTAMPDPDQLVWQVFATAGFAGGFVYWLLAGRNA